MSSKLHVPPPPTDRTATTRGARKGGRGTGTKRKRSSAGRLIRLVALIAALGMLSACLLLVVVPSVLSAGGDSRTNLLLLGIDRRGGTGWGYRTDTIMVVTLDPDSRTAGILSIPRDLQLPIPGRGQDRINTANVYGSRSGDPDGGPSLLASTIEGSFGIPIDGYLMVDFGAFVEIVDTLGGIEVDVPKRLHDTRYPDPKPGDPHAFKTIHFEPGPQQMDGTRALEYARSRMSTSDFDRAKRQQQVVLAIREKALSASAIPSWPKLAAVVTGSVRTDMRPDELLAVAIMAARADMSSLKQVVLEHPLVYGHRRSDGAAVQLPRWELINPVLLDLFGPRTSR
ncbi:MAG: cell envelope-related transcriptional attenuator [Anaerolineae bacterium]|nr:cell envelope-related transcriptional attenuator [Anaerolineae bacterium]